MAEHLDWPQLMDEALTAPGNLGSTYSRFHNYSFVNEMLFFMQGLHEPVASRSTWLSLGRTLVKGSKAKKVIVPVLVNEPKPKEEGRAETPEERKERVARLIGFKLVHAVFGLSDTEGKDLPEVQIPGWDLQTALSKLGITEEPFESTNGNVQGYSHDLRFAINPVAVNSTKTRFHEIAHILFGHTLEHHYEEYETHRGMMEFQAEATAYLVMNELELLDDDSASVSRAYIRFWLQDEHPPDQSIRQVFTVADRIIRAGRTALPGDTPHTSHDIEG